MHMADSLLSPVVGTAMWGATAGLIAYSAKKAQKDLDDSKAPFMGVLGAFVFAAQMINFAIPGTGSSGHLGGGLLLAILLGPYAAFLTITSILAIQALFFADGGLLALGANIFNLGFFPCFIAYPLVYRRLAASELSKGRLFAVICLAAVVGLQLGALAVVLETMASGISELPFTLFLLLMLPIHLAIGLVEGAVTAATVIFVTEAKPELKVVGKPTQSVRGLLIGILIAALLVGGMLSWFASADPDGLEWSIIKAAGKEELTQPEGLHKVLAGLQNKIAFLPDYNLPKAESAEQSEPAWPSIDGGQTVAGVAGVLITLLTAAAAGKLLQLAGRRARNS